MTLAPVVASKTVHVIVPVVGCLDERSFLLRRCFGRHSLLNTLRWYREQAGAQGDERI